MNKTTLAHPGHGFHRHRFDAASFFFKGLTGLATLLILTILAVILINIVINGWPGISWRFISTIPKEGFFEPESAGVLPMIVGTTIRVVVMTLFVLPIGVITAVYLTEYAQPNSPLTRTIRAAVNNLAGVPSIVFGLFGLGFFINFIGANLDAFLENPGPVWGQPAVLWAALTLAVMTLPVVIVATEESLRAIAPGLREASLALGATRLETVIKIVLPQALPGILTGGILAVSRAAGEVAPILFAGVAYYMATLPRNLNDQFMDLGYHVYVLSTQSPDIEKTRPTLYATVLVLLVLTFALNFVAIFIRARMRRKLRTLSLPPNRVMAAPEPLLKSIVTDPDPSEAPLPGNPLIDIEGISLFYGQNQALHDISFQIPENLVTALIGPSGCGKSTLLRCLNRMNDLIDDVRPSGRVAINGFDINAPDVDVIELRKRVGMVFQKSNPFPKSIYDNIAYGLRLQGRRSRPETDGIVEESLKGAALWDEVKDRLHSSALGLSGGQQQRLCIARAIAIRPDIILMDEPASALDPIATAKIEDLILDLKRQFTIVIVTHNMQQAARISDFTAFFYLGRLVEFDATRKIFTNPAHQQTEDYVTGRFG